MKLSLISLSAIFTLGLTANAQTVAFVFDKTDSINGNTALADSFKTTLDGETTATPFDLSSILNGLTVNVTPSSGDDISYTTAGIGVNTGGELDATDETITFSFNKPITLDFLKFASFTGGETFEIGEDQASIGFSNTNPSKTIVDADLNGSNAISFTSGTSLSSNDSFSISYADGNGFNIEEITVTVVPEPSTYALLTGLCGILVVILKRRRQ